MTLPNSPPHIEVYASGSWIGFHCWPAAPEKVSYLADRHRHKFCWKVWWSVSHGDREIEFCSMQEEIARFIDATAALPEMATWSCEHWAVVLLNKFHACRVEVSEDGENGAVVTA
jgi:hypothetical protein